MSQKIVWALGLLWACGGHGQTVNDAGADGIADASATTDGDDALPMDDTGSVTTGSRDFVLRARGMTTYQGRTLNLTVVESTGGHEMGYGIQASMAADEFDFRMPALLPSGDYHVDAFVDANGNGRYDGSSVDPSWRVTIPSDGSALAALNATDPTTDLGSMTPIPRLDARISLSGFTPDEMNQLFELRVIDASSLAVVGAYSLPQLTSTSLTITLPGMVDSGNSYNVDFYSDTDADGVYTGPGSDHTWRQTVTASDSGLSLQWQHTTTYTELDWQ